MALTTRHRAGAVIGGALGDYSGKTAAVPAPEPAAVAAPEPIRAPGGIEPLQPRLPVLIIMRAEPLRVLVRFQVVSIQSAQAQSQAVGRVVSRQLAISPALTKIVALSYERKLSVMSGEASMKAAITLSAVELTEEHRRLIQSYDEALELL